MAEVLGDQAALVKQNGFGVSARSCCDRFCPCTNSLFFGAAHDDLPALCLRDGYHHRILQRRDCTWFSCYAWKRSL